MTSSPPNDAQRASERARWQAFAVCVAVAAITILDISKVNVGLPSIEVSLGAGPSQVQLIVAGYALAFGLTLVPSGRLGDIHSRKTMFLIGLAAFTIASVLCAVAPTIEFLLIGRIAQGFAAGIQMPQVLGLIQQLFQGKERSRAFGLFGGAVGAATAFGPSIGGLLIFLGGAHDGWRLLFWMNVPLGAIALVLAFRLLPGRQHHEKKRMELDLVGILLLGLATLALMLPFVLTTGNPSDDPRRWFWLVGGAAAAVAFVFWEKSYARRGKSPAVHFALFRHPSYRNGLLIVSAFYAGLPAAFLLIALYAQQGLHVPPLFAGLMTLPYTLIQAFVAWQSSRFIDRFGRILVPVGVAIAIVGFVLVLLAAVSFPPGLAPWYIAAAMSVAGFGTGLVISPNQAITLSDVPVTQAGVAGSMTQLGQRVGNAIGFAAVVSTFYSVIHSETGKATTLVTFHDGLRNGLLVVFGLFVLTLIVALVDLIGYRRRRAAATSALD